MDQENTKVTAASYAENLATQLRKGFLAYCVLLICADKPKYTSDILKTLRDSKLVVVEGTIYPLLSRLQKDGLLEHEWQESDQGPPRKYYKLTDYGAQVAQQLKKQVNQLNKTLKVIEKEPKK
ncbi:PadR family transcriptional regulator [Candidatus Saccharibacteria bacterium]|nr:MAG: PadR family transcriptional regulator [Candidatus Saccharibacteria bacterium]